MARRNIYNDSDDEEPQEKVSDEVNQETLLEQDPMKGGSRVERDGTHSSTSHEMSQLEPSRSILKSSRASVKSQSRMSLSRRGRRRRKRRVSFQESDEIFIIPSRRQLREEEKAAIRKQRLRRKLTLRQRTISPIRSKIRRRTRLNSRSSTRKHRLRRNRLSTLRQRAKGTRKKRTTRRL